MPPKTRRRNPARATTIEYTLTTETVLSHEVFKKSLNYDFQIYMEPIIAGALPKFYDNLDNLLDQKGDDRVSAGDLKKAVYNCYKTLPRPKPLIPKLEIKEEVEMKSETEVILLTPNPQSQEGSSMEIDSAPNTTFSIFENKSHTMSSSEDDLDTTAIDEATSQLEEMSVNEVSAPLSSVHLQNKSFTMSSSDDEGPDGTAQDLMGDDTAEPIPLHSSTPLRDPVPAARELFSRACKQETKPMITRSASSKPATRALLTPKRELSVKSVDTKRGLRTPKKEVITNERMKHATDLRQKILNLKAEKARAENDRRAAVLERKRAQEMIKSESSYKSPSRTGPLRRIEKKTPASQRPSKKTRIHVSDVKEEKVVMTFPKAPPSEAAPKPPTTPAPVAPTSSKSKNSYQMTPDKVFKLKAVDDYGVDDLSSDDGTDDEDQPRKPIPEWAKNRELIVEAMVKEIDNPTFDIDGFFGTIQQPNLIEIFGTITNLKKRGSSAKW